MATIAPPFLKHQPSTFFAEILRERSKQKRGYLGLSEAITKAYRQNMIEPSALAATAVIIDRRKLKSLAEHDRNVNLSMVELEALHAYLEQLEEGLTHRPFFNFTSLVQELAESLDAAVIVPSRMGAEGPGLNYWDWQATAEIQRTVNLFSNTISFDLVDVARSNQETKPGAGKRWQRLFGESGPSSVICIGSPRSNRATEKALRSMFRPLPKEKDRWANLPFNFVFLSGEGQGGLPSLFSRPVDQLKGTHEKLVADVEAKKGWGLIVGNKSFLSQAAFKGKPSQSNMVKRIRSYGVIAAQRQEHRLVLAVAGLTGPGTLAAASRLSAMTGPLPRRGGPQENAVLWSVVETVVDTTRMRDGGPPVLEAHRFAVEPSLWDPKKRCPIGHDPANAL